MSQKLVINIMSFGFKKGIPEDAEMVFDMRFVQNPYYVEELRPLTGNDKAVSDYVMKDELTVKFIDDVVDMLRNAVPGFEDKDRESLNVCFGCTGGHHRSVAVSNEVYRRLEELGYNVTLQHRQLEK